MCECNCFIKIEACASFSYVEICDFDGLDLFNTCPPFPDLNQLLEDERLRSDSYSTGSSATADTTDSPSLEDKDVSTH